MDLRTNYLGLELKHPVVASAGPISQSLDGIRKLEDGGASAVVLFSLFEEQLRQENAAFEHFSEVGTEAFGEALSYFPSLPNFRVGPERYLDLIRGAKESLAIPVIASLNGVTAGGWTEYAKDMESAGADALELNIYHLPTNLDETGRDVEARYEDVVRAVRESVKIPIAVKLGPYFSSFGEMAKRMVAAGADGLVLFNRFYQPDIDLDQLEVAPTLELSTAAEIRLPLLWLAVLSPKLECSLAATTGVHTHREALKYLLAGADVAMTTSALLKNGPHHLWTIVEGLRDWLTQHDYESVAQMKGSMSQAKVSNPAAFERANYLKILQSYTSPLTAG